MTAYYYNKETRQRGMRISDNTPPAFWKTCVELTELEFKMLELLGKHAKDDVECAVDNMSQLLKDTTP